VRQLREHRALNVEDDHPHDAQGDGDGHQRDHLHSVQNGPRDDRLRRIEVITDREQRRRWLPEEKAKISAESRSVSLPTMWTIYKPARASAQCRAPAGVLHELVHSFVRRVNFMFLLRQATF
jgi:hypothetical protein